ncbi:MAG: site-specific DNA-methyltransferase [Tildeniella torsiva UHER 1998/13D]|jgi:site-specific DNA-methyltransferase (adenine-specific)|nr:site-specific DNA-methyltransferase [Tildeniella torsiva UHER 1998/13D]
MKARAPQNRTLDLTAEERSVFLQRLISLDCEKLPSEILNRTICQDLFEALPYLPKNFVDLLIVDPPYNLTKDFNGSKFRQCDRSTYTAWLDSWISQLKPVLKPHASVYFCADWATSTVMYPVLEKHFTVRNRITWEREKGRGAQANWKNASEDIWFCTVSETYTFNVNAVKLKRQVMAPYRDLAGHPKDWDDTGSKNYRLTHPSNLWTDITVPFWSMTENTDHPTQKPEKLVAKLLLASSNPGDVVLDPFLGSGTTAVVAKKLGRQYVGIEQDPDYCCLAEKRLALADEDPTIQGYADGVFWERNTLAAQRSCPKKSMSSEA